MMTVNCQNALCSRKDASLEPTAETWIKIDIHCRRQKCKPMTSFWKHKVHADMRLLLAGASNESAWGCWRRQFLSIWVATSSETSEIRPAILYDDMLPLSACEWLQNEWPRMTLSDYFMSKSVFGQHFLSQSVWISKIIKLIVWKETNTDPRCQQQKCRTITLVSANICCF